jgi:hypothetical protein
MNDQQVVKTLNLPIDKKALKTSMTCALVILASILMHDADHLRQAFNWGYSIPLALLVLNLVVYLLPAVSIFLIKMGRISAPLVTGFTGVFTTAGFLIIHLCGSFSGLWGVWNYSYFELMKGVTYNGAFYQGVDVWSWIFLFEVPALCLPAAAVSFKAYAKAKKAAENQ